MFLSNVENKSRFVTKLKSTLVQTAINLAKSIPEKKIVVVETDIDLAALMIALTADHLNIIMWKRRACPKQCDAIYESQKTKHLKNIILFAHAFTGCDTVSSIFGRRKKKLLDVIIKNDQMRQYVFLFFQRRDRRS